MRCVLQGVYKEELQQHFGIVFNNLFCLNNMPIKRYVDYLQRRNKLEEYMQVRNAASVMPCTPLSLHLLPTVTVQVQLNWR